MRLTFLLAAAAAAGVRLSLAGAAAPPLDPVTAVQGLITRLLGAAYVPAFHLEVLPPGAPGAHDAFELAPGGGGAARVTIRGTQGLSLAAGLGWYLKRSLNASWGWGRNGTGNSLSTLPPPGALPPPAAERRVSPVKWRYAYNVCTLGYTAAWWSPAQWQEEVDRLALWGVNLPLMFVGQERVWLDLYTSLGLSAADVQGGFFSGPAFLPWQRMGNIQAWGGPLDEAWVNASYAAGAALLGMMRDYGMTPVLPGWAGHIPSALVKLFPNANVTHSASWNGFNATYSSDYLLQPTDPLFLTIGRSYYDKLLAAFDVDRNSLMLNADTFNEMDPQSGDPSFLRESNAAIFAAMPPGATYVMQAWLFVNSPSFWTPSRTEAYLGGVPNASMLLLDLFTETTPTWSRYNSFYGKPWVWCMLQVFGGRRAIYGTLERLASGPVADLAAPGSTMAGIGITPEATEMSPATFDLILEMGWRAAAPAVPQWLAEWAVRRYGAASPSLLAAWDVLRVSNLNVTGYDYGRTTAFCLLCDAPQLEFKDWVANRITAPNGAVAALRLFLDAVDGGEVAATAGPFRQDLVDVARQVLCNVFGDYAVLRGGAYLPHQTGGGGTTPARVAATVAAANGIIADLDALLGSDVNYLLGNWLADARSWGATPGQLANREFNARNQITLWGPRGEIADYAAKNWAGLTRDYYGARWALHGRVLVDAVSSGRQVDWAAYEASRAALEWAWNTNTSDAAPYATSPVGDPVALARGVVAKYLTPSSPTAYTRLDGQDITGSHVDLMRAWNTDPSVLMRLCDVDPTCVGFNVNGYLKNSTATRVNTAASTLWLKNA